MSAQNPISALPLFRMASVPASQWLGGMPAGSVAIETSEHAADALTPDALDKRRRLVLTFFQTRENATADEACAYFHQTHNTIAPRCSELLGMGLLERLDGNEGRPKVRRTTRAGGNAYALRVRKIT